MRIKKAVRKFCTLNPGHADGFTLVELIVVIAILAILAGVSVPIYGGYIKKANEAADNQLLAAINTAFASACVESKVDVKNVTAASISVQGQKVYGVSSVTAMETGTSAAADLDVICPAFLKYYAGNEDAVFKAENVNSLVWNDDANSFECSEAYADMRFTLSNGKTVVIPAEDVAKISESTFADMGYAGVKTVVSTLNKSTGLLGSLLGLIDKSDRLTNAMVASGLLSQAEADELCAKLNKNDSAALTTANNGLQMVVAKYLANPNLNTDDLMNIDLGSSNLATVNAFDKYGGSATTAAVAMQYAMVSTYANANPNTPITVTEGIWPFQKDVTYSSVNDYLAQASDPIAAINNIKKTTGYTDYTKTEQYQADKQGFVDTMGIVGNNLGTYNNEGAISIDSYFQSGINSNDAKEVLTELLGSGTSNG